MSSLLIATLNQGKRNEAQLLLQGLGWEVITLAQVPNHPELAELDVEETGTTFTENAEIKAMGYGIPAGVLTVADDSGLEVVALDNQPGVYSKRFIPGSDHDRNVEILKRMVGQTNRAARFVTVLCLFDPTTGQKHFFEGEVKGHLATEEIGEQGFGYDPIFIPEGYDQTFAEVDIEVKNVLSHRAQAFTKLKEYLVTQSKS